MFAYVSDKKLMFFVGIVAAILNGLIFPFFSIFLSKMLATLVNFGSNPQQARDEANQYSLYFLLFGINAFIFNLVQMAIFSHIGEDLTQKVRNETYLKMLKMPIAWFDKPKNSSGSLASRLASDCSAVNDLITTFVAITIQSLTTLIAGVVIALIY